MDRRQLAYTPAKSDTLVNQMLAESRAQQPPGGQLRLTPLERAPAPVQAIQRANVVAALAREEQHPLPIPAGKVGDLYKCNTGGKITYQHTLCEGAGAAIKVVDSKAGRAVTPLELLQATIEEKGRKNGRRYENGRLVAEVKDGGVVVPPQQLAQAQPGALQQAKARCRAGTSRRNWNASKHYNGNHCPAMNMIVSGGSKKSWMQSISAESATSSRTNKKPAEAGFAFLGQVV